MHSFRSLLATPTVPATLQPDELSSLSLNDLAKLLDERKSMLASITSSSSTTSASPPMSPYSLKSNSLPRTSGSFDSGCEVGLDAATAEVLFGSAQQQDTMAASVPADTGSAPRKLTPQERVLRIQRYRAKRHARNFNRRINYQCRKKVADARPRVRGRFARDDELGAVLPEERAQRDRRSAEDQLADEVLA